LQGANKPNQAISRVEAESQIDFVELSYEGQESQMDFVGDHVV
jgi:hypothetical protein